MPRNEEHLPSQPWATLRLADTEAYNDALVSGVQGRGGASRAQGLRLNAAPGAQRIVVDWLSMDRERAGVFRSRDGYAMIIQTP